MSGNAIEEGLLRDGRSPAHSNRQVAGLAVAMLVWMIGGGVAAASELSGRPLLAVFVGVFVAGLLAGIAAHAVGERGLERARSEEAEARRAAQMAESRKQIAAMKARQIEERRSEGPAHERAERTP